jgi:hypothetical protein
MEKDIIDVLAHYFDKDKSDEETSALFKVKALKSMVDLVKIAKNNRNRIS